MLDQLNERLKVGRVGVRVEQRGERLYLVATLPPKIDSGRARPYQQRIALGINANPAGIKRAELEAKKLGIQLTEGSFTWEPKRERIAIPEAIELFKVKYFVERGHSPKTETTWNSNYASAFKKLPSVELTPEILIKTIGSIPANTRARQLACQALKSLASHFGIDLDVSKLRGNYGQKSVKPRNLPTDKEIVEAINLFSNQTHQWAFGMMATYALRNHEVFLVDLDYLTETGVCNIIEKDGLSSKSRGGKVWPLFPDWVELFGLKDVRVPKMNGKNNREKGQKVNKAFARANIPFHPYALRHSWARRSIELGLDSRLAAQQMRHSHQIHTNTYNAWLTDADHSKAWDAIVSKLNASQGE
jgi:integrase